MPRRAQTGVSVEIIAALMSLNTMHGAATTYAGEYVGQPLFCSTPQRPLFYDQATPPWVALPVSGDWQCGDLVYIRPVNAPSFMARVYDAGPFGNHCVQQADHCAPIVVDVPSHLATRDGLSANVEVVNISAVARACRERGVV